MITSTIPPHNIDAEQAVLGAILLNNTVFGLVAGRLSAADFYEPLHGRIFQQAGDLIAEGKNANPITLKSALPDVQLPNGMTVHRYLVRLAADGATALNVEGYASLVLTLSQMRGFIDLGTRLSRFDVDGVLPDAAMSEVWDEVDNLRNAGRRDGGHRGSIAALAPRLLETDAAAVAPSGLADLDKAIAGGWRAGRLYVLAGRPGMGKTVLAVSAVRRVARKDIGVSIFSLEIDEREILARLVADELSHSMSPVPYRDIVAGKLDESTKPRVADALERLAKLPLRIDADGGLSITEIEARVRIDRDIFARAGKRLGLVVIDYLGLIKATDRYRGNKVHELGEIALAGKTMAKRLDCAVVLLAQLNRSVESRDDKRPTMSDLRDSGNIEEHADMVGLLYRPMYYLEKSPGWRNCEIEAIEAGQRERNTLELIVGKNRLGATEIVKLWCEPSTSSVDNLSRYV